MSAKPNVKPKAQPGGEYWPDSDVPQWDRRLGRFGPTSTARGGDKITLVCTRYGLIIRTPDGRKYPGSLFCCVQSKLPQVEVACELSGFEASPALPLHWRLELRHARGRDRRAFELHGRAYGRSFRPFDKQLIDYPKVSPDELADLVLGAEAVLSVAALPTSAEALLDYAFLAFRAVTPAAPVEPAPITLSAAPPWPPDPALRRLLTVSPLGSPDKTAKSYRPRSYGGGHIETKRLKAAIAELVHQTTARCREKSGCTTRSECRTRCDTQLAYMAGVIVEKESGGYQFQPRAQSEQQYRMTKAKHAPCECTITFRYPADPPGFPNVNFDFGVGLSQYTWLRDGGQHPWPANAWNWRESLRMLFNVFVRGLQQPPKKKAKANGKAKDQETTRKVRHPLEGEATWIEWARWGFARYAGSSDPTGHFATSRAESLDGLEISRTDLVPAKLPGLLKRFPELKPEPRDESDKPLLVYEMRKRPWPSGALPQPRLQDATQFTPEPPRIEGDDPAHAHLDTNKTFSTQGWDAAIEPLVPYKPNAGVLASPVGRVGEGGKGTLAPGYGLLLVRPRPGKPYAEYVPGSIPRQLPSGAFQENAYRLTLDPRMPVIEVMCQLAGFTPTEERPLFWRLQCQHVLARYRKTNSTAFKEVTVKGKKVKAGYWRYKPAAVDLYMEWRGRAYFRTPAVRDRITFKLFEVAPSPQSEVVVEYDYNRSHGDHIMGGHGILTVAAQPPGGGDQLLLDYAHLLITGGGSATGRQPVRVDVDGHLIALLQPALRDCRCPDRNAAHCARCLDNIRQIAKGALFQRDGRRPQPPQHHAVGRQENERGWCRKCRGKTIRLRSWPADPKGFPLVAYDFRAGLTRFVRLDAESQETDLDSLTAGIAWNWRDNLRASLDVLIEAANASLAGEMRWRELMQKTWEKYALAREGDGALAARWARELATRQRRSRAFDEKVPSGLKLASVPAAPSLAPPPRPWPPKPLDAGVNAKEATESSGTGRVETKSKPKVDPAHVEVSPEFPAPSYGEDLTPFARNRGACGPKERANAHAHGAGETLAAPLYGLRLARPQDHGFGVGTGSVFTLNLDPPRMPTISVELRVKGFLPTEAKPIFWQLRCRHILCRYTRSRADEHDHFTPSWKELEMEWQGRLYLKSTSGQVPETEQILRFTIFDAPSASTPAAASQPAPAPQPIAGSQPAPEPQPAPSSQPASGSQPAPSSQPTSGSQPDVPATAVPPAAPSNVAVTYDYNGNDGVHVMGGYAALSVAANPNPAAKSSPPSSKRNPVLLDTARFVICGAQWQWKRR